MLMRTNVNNDINKISKHGGQYSEGDQAKESCHRTSHCRFPARQFRYCRAGCCRLLDEGCLFRDLEWYIGE